MPGEKGIVNLNGGQIGVAMGYRRQVQCVPVAAEPQHPTRPMIDGTVRPRLGGGAKRRRSLGAMAGTKAQLKRSPNLASELDRAYPCGMLSVTARENAAQYSEEPKMKSLSMLLSFGLAAVANCNAWAQDSKPLVADLVTNGECEQCALDLKPQMSQGGTAQGILAFARSDDLALARDLARKTLPLAKGDDENLVDIALLQLDLGAMHGSLETVASLSKMRRQWRDRDFLPMIAAAQIAAPGSRRFPDS